MSEQLSTNEHPLAFDQFATWHCRYLSCCHGEPCCRSCEDHCVELSQEQEDE